MARRYASTLTVPVRDGSLPSAPWSPSPSSTPHAPTIAAFVEERIETTGLCFLATTRADGWPRVSPLELSVCDGRIYMGSMPGAMKAHDLQRDGRCCLITPLADKDDLGGEGKLFCRARQVEDLAEYEAVRAVVQGAHRLRHGRDGRRTRVQLRHRGRRLPAPRGGRQLAHHVLDARSAASGSSAGAPPATAWSSDATARGSAWWSSKRADAVAEARRRRSCRGRARPRSASASVQAEARGRRRRIGGRSRRRATGTTRSRRPARSAVSSASPSGTTRLRKPIRSASSAPISRPVRMRSRARPSPTICGSR